MVDIVDDLIRAIRNKLDSMEVELEGILLELVALGRMVLEWEAIDRNET